MTVATPASSSQPLASKTGKQSCQNQRLSITKRERRRSPPHESLARREQRSRAEPSRAQTAPGGPPRPSPGGGGLATSRSCFPSRLQALPPRSPTAAGEAPPPPPRRRPPYLARRGCWPPRRRRQPPSSRLPSAAAKATTARMVRSVTAPAAATVAP